MVQELTPYKTIILFNYSFVSSWICIKVLEIQLHQAMLPLFERQLALDDRATQLSCCLSSCSSWMYELFSTQQPGTGIKTPTGYGRLCPPIISWVPQNKPLVYQLQQHIITWGNQAEIKHPLLPSWQARKVSRQHRNRGKGGGRGGDKTWRVLVRQ